MKRVVKASVDPFPITYGDARGLVNGLKASINDRNFEVTECYLVPCGDGDTYAIFDDPTTGDVCGVLIEPTSASNDPDFILSEVTHSWI